MIERLKIKSSSFIEISALDWFPILLDDSKFPHSPLPDQERIAELVEGIEDVGGEELDEIIDHLQRAFNQENERKETIESKAFILIGATGIAFSFVVGFVQILDGNGALPAWGQTALIILYLGIGTSLLLTVLIAKKAIEMGKYVYKRFANEAYLKLPQLGREPFYREYASNMLAFVEHNHAVNNDKATCVIGAQNWFRNAVVLFFFLLVLLSITPYVSKPLPARTNTVIVVTPTPASTASPTPPAAPP